MEIKQLWLSLENSQKWRIKVSPQISVIIAPKAKTAESDFPFQPFRPSNIKIKLTIVPVP